MYYKGFNIIQHNNTVTIKKENEILLEHETDYKLTKKELIDVLRVYLMFRDWEG